MCEEMEIKYRKMCVLLEECDKNGRKRGLNCVKEILKENCESNNSAELVQMWCIFQKPLIRILNFDQVESNRESSIEILQDFISMLAIDEKHIVYIIPVLTRRLGSAELLEPSEEIRLKCVAFVRMLITKYQSSLVAYLDDLVTILSRTVTDNYPNVKKESCEAISDLSKILAKHFYEQSDKFVKAILANFVHQHYKVRAAAVYTIGDVLLAGKSILMEQVATPMAQRLFDQSSAVRKAVVEVAGKWLIDLRDKYSWWYKLIPLILTGLHDEIQQIRDKSAELWDKAGLKYLQENESDVKVKDQMDFLTNHPQHYPPNIKRPNLGCRIIVQQNFGKLVNGIVAELNDWLVDVKIRSAQLLCVLVFTSEEDVTIHFEKLLPAMYRACNDDDQRVVENIEQAAKYMGYFIPPKTYCPLILLSFDENPTSGHLRVFASILSGSERQHLQPELKNIADFIQQNYRHSCAVKYQSQVLNCCESLMSVCQEDCREISCQLVFVIFSVMAITESSVLKAKAKELVLNLTSIEHFQTIHDLYSKHIKHILFSIADSCESWTVYSPDFKILEGVIVDACSIVIWNNQILLPILEKATNTKADAKVRLKVYILLSKFIADDKDVFRNKPVEILREFTHFMLEKVICPGLIWSAGRTADALRTASVSLLCAILAAILDQQNEQHLDGIIDDFTSFFQQTIPILVSLLDDNEMKTKFYSLKAICLIVMIGRQVGCISEHHIHVIYPALLKRLDDGNDVVRIGAIEALQEVWRQLPENYDLQFFRTHIDMVYTTTIIHLDDPEEKFQKLMLDAMKSLAKVHPGLLLQKIEKCRYNFRNQEGLDCLLKCVREYLENAK